MAENISEDSQNIAYINVNIYSGVLGEFRTPNLERLIKEFVFFSSVRWYLGLTLSLVVREPRGRQRAI